MTWYAQDKLLGLKFGLRKFIFVLHLLKMQDVLSQLKLLSTFKLKTIVLYAVIKKYNHLLMVLEGGGVFLIFFKTDYNYNIIVRRNYQQYQELEYYKNLLLKFSRTKYTTLKISICFFVFLDFFTRAGHQRELKIV